jgi:hypothetical protein
MPVLMNSGNSLLEQLQTNEWRYLQFITWLSSEVKLPMMCNGANLIFKRQLFMENIEAHRSISSGDDMFLLSRVMKVGGDTSMCWEKFVRVEISTVNSWRESINQRIRWVGKITKLPSSKASVLHALFALISAIHVFAFIGLFIPSWHLESATFLSVKVLAEVLCMYGVFSNRMKMKEVVLALIAYSMVVLFLISHHNQILSEDLQNRKNKSWITNFLIVPAIVLGVTLAFSALFIITKNVPKISKAVLDKKLEKQTEIMLNPMILPSHPVHIAVKKFYLGKKTKDDGSQWLDKVQVRSEINERNQGRLKDKLAGSCFFSG